MNSSIKIAHHNCTACSSSLASPLSHHFLGFPSFSTFFFSPVLIGLHCTRCGVGHKLQNASPSQVLSSCFQKTTRPHPLPPQTLVSCSLPSPTPTPRVLTSFLAVPRTPPTQVQAVSHLSLHPCSPAEGFARGFFVYFFFLKYLLVLGFFLLLKPRHLAWQRSDTLRLFSHHALKAVFLAKAFWGRKRRQSYIHRCSC